VKLAIRNRRQLLLLAGLGAILVLALVRMRGGSSGAVPNPRPPSGGPRAVASAEEEHPGPSGARAARAEKKVNPDEVPIITTRDLESPNVRQQSEGRNIFDFRPPTLPPPPTPTPAPPAPPAPGDPRFVGPLPPPAPTPTPLPPDISFKFIGTFGPKDRPIAVLAQGTEVVNAREGEVVFRVFIIRKIGYESIDVGFVGRDPKESRRLALTP
jgi:hypothetical protein